MQFLKLAYYLHFTINTNPVNKQPKYSFNMSLAVFWDDTTNKILLGGIIHFRVISWYGGYQYKLSNKLDLTMLSKLTYQVLLKSI